MPREPSPYLRAACHAVLVAERAGDRLARLEASRRWPYPDEQPGDWLAGWLLLAARERLARATRRRT
jgi:hypothetical protein